MNVKIAKQSFREKITTCDIEGLTILMCIWNILAKIVGRFSTGKQIFNDTWKTLAMKMVQQNLCVINARKSFVTA